MNQEEICLKHFLLSCVYIKEAKSTYWCVKIKLRKGKEGVDPPFYFVSMVCFSLARAFRYSGLIKWSSSSFLFSFWEFSNRWARCIITFVNSFSIFFGLWSSFFCWAANCRSFCFSSARCNSLFWLRTFLPL